ncbi:hypothetical protein HYT51_00800 [Candidatus Woesearchaeota archaeon]|nr:hypothetical protein [Candidatus Woesearchaeota archaeon]
MGTQKYLKKIEEIFQKSQVVTYNSIERVVKEKKNNTQYTKQLIKNLIAKGKIKRLAKGGYTAHNENGISVFCFTPAYLGLQDALSFHNIWEQETIPVIITSRRVRQGIRSILGGNVLLRRIDKKYLFGFEYYAQGNNVYLPYSDIEKTLIDMVYFKEKIDKEVIKNLIKKIQRKKLNKYLKRYPIRIKMRILKILKKS